MQGINKNDVDNHIPCESRTDPASEVDDPKCKRKLIRYQSVCGLLKNFQRKDSKKYYTSVKFVIKKLFSTL